MTTSEQTWPSTDCNGITLVDPIGLTLAGTVVVLARKAAAVVDTLYYNVRISGADPGVPQEWAGWNELRLDGNTTASADDRPLLRIAGMDLITVDSAVAAPKPANAPFRAVTDGRYISCFRQSATGSLYMDRFALVRTPPQQTSGSRDGETLDGWRMERVWEVRYRRSERRDAPAGPGDELGFRNMIDEPFHEPTIELPVLSGITGGRFDVLLAPTSDAEISRWHIVAVTGEVLTFVSYPQDGTGGMAVDPALARTFTITPTLWNSGESTALTPTAGAGVSLYAEQERTGTEASLRRAVRLSVTVPVTGAGLPGALAVYDFGVLPDGTIPVFPAGIGCVLIDGTLHDGRFTASTGDHSVPGKAVRSADAGTVSAVLLGTPRPAATPTVIDSADGLVHCYFPQPSGSTDTEAFAVAQFDPTVTRTQITLPWKADDDLTGTFTLIALRSGSTFDNVVATVAPCVRGGVTAPDLCDVTIDYGTGAGLPRESWGGVPRDVRTMVSILNGAFSEDPADKAVLSGARPFYDFLGHQPSARLPLASAGRLVLVSHRPDMPLSRVEITAAANGTVDLTVRYTSDTGATAVQTWRAVPVGTANATPILSGDADPATYSYQRAATDTPVYALSTHGGSILLFGKAAEDLSLTISPADGDPAHCTVSLTIGTHAAVELENVPREQAGFVARLRAWSAADAVFAAISEDSKPGPVADQSFTTPLDLRGGSVLFDVLTPADVGDLAPGQVDAADWQGRSLTPTPPDGTVGRAMIAMAALPPESPLFGREPRAADCTSTRTVTGDNGKWLAAHQAKALALNGHQAMSVALTNTQLAPRPTWTMEAWIRPKGSDPATVFTYDNGPAKGLGELTPSYYLGVAGLPTVRFGAFIQKNNAKSSYLAVPSNPAFTAGPTGFTWEAWIKPDARPCPKTNRLGSILQVCDTKSKSKPLLNLGLDFGRHLTLGYRPQSHEPKSEYLTAATALPAGVWSHVAATGSWQNGTWTLSIYVGAVLAKTVRNVKLQPPSKSTSPTLAIGAAIGPHVSMFGALSDVRLWSFARTPAELRYTNTAALTGSEPGLEGAWSLAEAHTAAKSVFANHATATGSALDAQLKLTKSQAVGSSDDDPFIGIVAGVGGTAPVRARARLRPGEWNHVAVSYQAARALKLNLAGATSGPPAYGVCPEPGDLTFDGQFSIDCWVQVVGTTGLWQTILSQWGESAKDQSFRLALDADGYPFCTVGLVDPASGARTRLTVRGKATAPDGMATHIAVTLTSAQVKVSGKQALRCTLTIYVNGFASGTAQATLTGTKTVTSVDTSAPLTLGIGSLPSKAGRVALEAQGRFAGALSGLRFWSIGLPLDQVRSVMRRDQAADADDGVVSAWWFTEGSGNVAADSVNDNDFLLTDTDLWGVLNSVGRYECYHDGQPIGSVIPAPAGEVVGYRGYDQCTVGAYEQEAGKYQGNLNGSLAEVRIWRSARTRSQVTSTLYRKLKGDETDLAGYWSLDNTSADLTGRGANGHLVGSPGYVASTAPVTNEGPQLTNVYQGPRTRFQRPLSGRAAVVEYPEMENHGDGTPYAVMRRAYFFVDNALTLSTGYGMGETDLVYLGQVQTQPRLIGYIEGAPPVPSENLSRPLYDSPFGYNSYQDASTVTLRSGESTSVKFTSSDYKTALKMEIDTKAGVAAKWADSASVLAWTHLLTAGTGKIGARHKSNLEIARQRDETYLSAWTRTTTDTLGLRGMWEQARTDRSDYLNPVVGRRYQPLNVGYALVESMTADLYAMRLHATGAMVGKVVLPDLGIPPDRNIITFQIDPRYVKNGTLDGKVGLVNDPDYPRADVARGSYFKPDEAYRLAAKIAKSDTDMRSRYNQFKAESLGERGSADLDGIKDKQYYDFGRDVPARGIANRYVWTASGGLHTETEQFSATHERVYTGFSDYTHLTGLTGEIAFTAQYGLYGAIDALFGGHVKVQVGKSESESLDFSLAVTCTGDPMLQGYHAGTGYTPEYCPGKVDAYRFMSIYLPPSVDNGDTFHNQVIDREWLTSSSDPDAVALRNVQLTGQGVWRLLHRVTYVSRVPPLFDTNPDQTVAPEPAQVIDLADNPLLIELVEDEVTTGTPSPADIGTGVANVLAPLDGRTASKLGNLVPWWAAFLAATRRPKPDPVKVALLNRILTDTVAYFQAGYASGLLPRPESRPGGHLVPAPRTSETASTPAPVRVTQTTRRSRTGQASKSTLNRP
ncbi:LamG-like jellyroll fold domain-containing protein [Amycolatopsis sp. cmx-4-54]|uniref:LamG domain-containing protein n=1 Tax=Amycolatopsis sp. cmx-4-54 TaxID=2790936 RepID=UPI00397B9EC1